VIKFNIHYSENCLFFLILVILIIIVSACKPEVSMPDTSTYTGGTSTSGGTNPPPTQYGTVTGIIKSVSTTSPISGVVVTCAGVSATTVTDGKFQLNNVATGTQTLTASKSGYDSFSKSISVTTGTTNVDVQMTVSTSGASIDGIIKDYETNAVLSGVKVTIAGATDFTDASGHYQLPSVPQGQQTITAQLANYDDYSGTTYLYSGNKKFDIAMTWKMPRVGSGSASYTDVGYPLNSGYPYPLTDNAKTILRRNKIIVSVNGVYDAKGISTVELSYTILYYFTANVNNKIEVMGTQYLHWWTQNLALSGTRTYSSTFYVGDDVAYANNMYAVLYPAAKPYLTITDTDGNIVKLNLNW
jgi:hypothetical protein